MHVTTCRTFGCLSSSLYISYPYDWLYCMRLRHNKPLSTEDRRSKSWCVKAVVREEGSLRWKEFMKRVSCSSGVNLAVSRGGRRVDPEGLVGTRGWVWRVPIARKKWIFTWNCVFCAFWFLSGTFCPGPCPCENNVSFSTWSGDLLDVEVASVALGNNEYSVS